MSGAPSDHPLEQFVRSLELKVPLSASGRAAVRGLPIRIRTMEAAAYLTREGDRPEHCGILASGYAYRQKQTSRGERQIVGLHIPGEALDLQHLFLSEADHSVQMLTRGEVGMLARSDLQDLVATHSDVAKAIMVAVLIEASIFREWVLNVGRRDAKSRIAHLLCEFAIRLRSHGLATGDPYILPITQEQLADAVGLTPVHVNRTLKALQAEGFIERDKRNVSFPSWARLREVADFNQRYLHLPAVQIMAKPMAAPAR